MESKLQAESAEPSWFSAGVIPKPSNAGELLIVRYWFDWNPPSPGTGKGSQVKFPGGSKKPGIDRTPEDTLIRELAEEVFSSGVVLRQSPLHSETSVGKGGHRHAKRFFLVQNFQGEFRQQDLLEQEQGTAENPDGPIRTERMAPPEFIDVATLAGLIFHRHAGALRAYCQHLAESGCHAREAGQAIKVLTAKSFRRSR